MRIKLKSTARIYTGQYVNNKTLQSFETNFDGNTKDFVNAFSEKMGVPRRNIIVETYKSLYEVYDIDPEIIRQYGDKVDTREDEAE